MDKLKDKLELIDFQKKGNAIRLYFGKNGKQYGDDWNDTPYEHNAGIVYDQFVKQIYDVFLPVDLTISEPADNAINSPYCKNDFIHKKSWVIWVSEEYNDERDPVGLFFGDTFKEINDKLSPYQPIFRRVPFDEEA